MNLKEHREQWWFNMHAFPQVRSFFSKRDRKKVLFKDWVSAGRAVCMLG